MGASLVRLRGGVTLAATTFVGAAVVFGIVRMPQGVARPNMRAVHPLFDMRSPDASPFPADRVTVADDENLTRRRVDLPLPVDCVTNRSDCEDVRVLNELDGFSTRPLISIPFDGDIDPSTVRGNLFFVALGDTTHEWNARGAERDPSDEVDGQGLSRRPGFGRITGVYQIVWDPATRVLHAKPDRLFVGPTRPAFRRW